MIDSREKMRKAIYEIGNLFEDAEQDVATENAEITGDNKTAFQEEMAKREKDAFLEGYRYAIRVLEESLVKVNE